jgi:hypothetical protein
MSAINSTKSISSDSSLSALRADGLEEKADLEIVETSEAEANFCVGCVELDPGYDQNLTEALQEVRVQEVV